MINTFSCKFYYKQTYYYALIKCLAESFAIGTMPVVQFIILITPVLWIESKSYWKIWLCCSNNGANQTNLKVAGFCGKEEIGICPVWVAVLVRSSNKTSRQQENQETVQLDHFWWTPLDWLMHCLDDNPSYISWQGVDFLRIVCWGGPALQPSC